MKWKPKPKPAIGAQRTRVVFVILPVLCDDGYYRFLETVLVHEQYAVGLVSYRFLWIPIGYEGLQ